MTGNCLAAFLSAGIIFGLSAGFSPGPLLALVVSHTISHGMREGIKVALAPLITDLPIILFSFFLLNRFAQSQTVLGCVSLLGGCFVLYLAVDNFRTRSIRAQYPEKAPQSLGRGVIVNLLSPHPYLFWLSVGAPMMVKAWTQSPMASAAFLAGFYACLVGAKILLAFLTGKCRQQLAGRAHIMLLRLLGLLLLAFACLLLKEGLHLLGWLP